MPGRGPLGGLDAALDGRAATTRAAAGVRHAERHRGRCWRTSSACAPTPTLSCRGPNAAIIRCVRCTRSRAGRGAAAARRRTIADAGSARRAARCAWWTVRDSSGSASRPPARQREHAGRSRRARIAAEPLNCNRITNLASYRPSGPQESSPSSTHDSSDSATGTRADHRRDPPDVRPRRGAAVHGRGAAQPRAGRSRGHGRVPARAHASQGAARDRAGARGRARRRRRRRADHRGAERLPERLPRSAARSCSIARTRTASAALPASPTARPSSSTRRSTRTRRRTSATCATPRSATRWSACSASAARRSRSRTTSTTPASRSRTSSSASASSSTRRSTEVRHIADTTRFDYYCWDLYSQRHRVVRRRQGAPRRSARAALHDLEHGGNETAAMGAFIVDRIVRAHLKTMARLNIGYDLLTYEGDILRLQFWAHAFEILKAQGAVFLQTEGKLAGCWVMRIDEGGDADAEPTPATDDRRRRGARKGDRPLERRRDLRRQGHRQPVLEVRPARPRLPLPPVRDAGRTAARCGRRRPATANRRRRRSARRKRIYNVIDSRQMYLQALLSQALRTLGHPTRPRTRSISRTRWWRCRTPRRGSWAIQPADGDEAKKPFVEVSGRKGLGVKIDDLLDLLIEQGARRSRAAQSRVHAEECRRVGVADRRRARSATSC